MIKIFENKKSELEKSQNTKKDECIDKSCLICFGKTDMRRANLPQYICTCNYYIHKECFTEWKKYSFNL